MASSNRHWPSMFKSKPCNSHHHHQQWQHHDIISSGSCLRSPYSSGSEERSPEPKPRWNPKPEQIRILEAIFNSGMVNPPRDEIRKIRAQLQEFGQVGDANVFYWFQNRKSRSKHKKRNLQTAAAAQNNHQPPPASTTAATSSSSSSDKSSPNSKSIDKVFSLLNSPTGSVNQQVQPYFEEFLQEPYFFQPSQHVGSTNAASGGFTQGFCFPEMGNVVHVNGNDQTVGSCSLLTDLMMMSHGISSKNGDSKAEEEKMKMQQQLHSYTTPPSTSAGHTILPPTSTVTIPSTITQIQGIEENGGLESGRSTVFINDMPIDVGVGPVDVREAIGDDCVLLHSNGQPVMTDEWGVTIQPLQHGTSYYVVPRSFNPSPLSTIDLI